MTHFMEHAARRHEFSLFFTWHRSFDERRRRSHSFSLFPLPSKAPLLQRTSEILLSREKERQEERKSERERGREEGPFCDLADMLNWSWTIWEEAWCRPNVVLAVVGVYIPDWIPEKGRRDGVKGLPFARRIPRRDRFYRDINFRLGTFAFPRACLFNSYRVFLPPVDLLGRQKIASDRYRRRNGFFSIHALFFSNPALPPPPPPPLHPRLPSQDFASKRRKWEERRWSDFKYKMLAKWRRC